MTCEAFDSGRRCEEMCEQICLSLGYAVSPAPRGTSPFDLVVNGLRVQVKKRTLTQDQAGRTRYRVELKTGARGKGFAYKPGQVDAFVFLVDGDWFVVPSAFLSRGDGFIPNTFDPRDLRPFAHAWHVLAGGDVTTERQLGFDF